MARAPRMVDGVVERDLEELEDGRGYSFTDKAPVQGELNIKSEYRTVREAVILDQRDGKVLTVLKVEQH